MTRLSRLATVLVSFYLAMQTSSSVTRADDEPDKSAKTPLEGVWIAQSLESEGRPAPDKVVKITRFTFKGDKLLVRGNTGDGGEDKCSFTIDASKSPKHLTIMPPKEDKPVLCIYEIEKDQLKICIRHANSDAGRPTAFATKAESQLILAVFKRQ